MSIKEALPTSEQIYYAFRHLPLHPKNTKDHSPQLLGIREMKSKWSACLPIPFARAKPIYPDNIFFSQIFYC